MQNKAKKSKAKVVVLDNAAALIQQLAGEIGARRPQISKLIPLKTTEDRPRYYYYSKKSDSDEVNEAEKEDKALIIEKKIKTALKGEHALYPLLAEYLTQEFQLYSKRVNEQTSSNKHGSNGNKWLHPDLVAMEDLSNDWDQEIKACVKEYSQQKTRLWSFEVKILINRSNVREVFFQTVSNSSWANFAYLVTSEINSDALKEIRILSSLHGIGLIILDKDNVSESQILIPAREKIEVDWNSVNRLVIENKDFRQFVTQVKHLGLYQITEKVYWYKYEKESLIES
ncbi:HrgA protein [Bartonella sp. HY038]|uniref:HrgA protein n=1 Tax=Bartonella sp. HY038 TaxID=2759660 RepID=UPI001FF06524|nr:HrgA protein [Bartonella sp. HY038]